MMSNNPIELVGKSINNIDDIIPYLVEIDLPDSYEHDAFLRVRETLTRLGVPNGKTLYQTCHILHKSGRYYIVHFKIMYMLDGGFNHLTVDDVMRQNLIADLLEQWGCVRIINPTQVQSKMPINKLKIVKHHQLRNGEWKTVPKYNIGTN